jgi:APA family basic amino acid/polyamine antiporter
VVNVFGVNLGAMIQNVFTSAKALSLGSVDRARIHRRTQRDSVECQFRRGSERILEKLWLEHIASGTGGRWRPDCAGEPSGDSRSGASGSLFSADAWNNITFTAGEVKNPRRNIPLSLILGVGFVLTVYFLASLAYLLVLPMHGDPHGTTALSRGLQYAAEDRVATAALEVIFHSGGAYMMAAAILVSTFGCANGMSLAGARVYYAMSKDGLFFKSVGKLHPRYRTPAAGLLVQAAWTAVLCVSGSYSQLLDYIIFAALVFYMPHHRGALCAAVQGA